MNDFHESLTHKTMQSDEEDSKYENTAEEMPMSLKISLQERQQEEQDAMLTPYTPFTPDEFKYDFGQSYKDDMDNRNKNKNGNESGGLMHVEHLGRCTLLKRIITELMISKERKLLYFAIFLAVCCSVLRLIFFIFMGAIFDIVSNTYNPDNYTFHSICDFHITNCNTDTQLIRVFIISLIILAIITSLINLFQSISIIYCSISLLKRLNCLIFDCIIDKSLSFFDCSEMRDLRHLLTTDMKNIHRTVRNEIMIIIQSFIHFMCCLIYIFIYKWDIGIIFIIGFLFLIIISFAYYSKYNIICTVRANSFKLVVMQIAEMLNYITTIVTFSKQDDEKFLYKLCIDRAFECDKNKNIWIVIYQFIVTIIIYGTILGVIWYGAYKYTCGMLVLILLILIQLKLSIYKFITLFNDVDFNSIERILNTYEMDKLGEDIERNISDKIINENIIGLVEMKHIFFSYPKRGGIDLKTDGNKFILNNISLRFEPNSMTALIGKMGSGKQTILKLIMKFYEIQKGQILIDNININKYNLSFLHSKIGYITMENIHLFKNRSIKDNITFGMLLDRAKQKSQHILQFDILDDKYFDATNLYFWREFKSINIKDIQNACKVANIHGFICNLKNGYDTIIGGKNGIKLSYTEKKRIAIARAVLLNPKILLLDESIFVGNDAISKYLMQETLNKIIQNRCVIIIANKLKTLKISNNIYVINNGKIVQYGKHNELIKNKQSMYFKLTQGMT